MTIKHSLEWQLPSAAKFLPSRQAVCYVGCDCEIVGLYTYDKMALNYLPIRCAISVCKYHLKTRFIFVVSNRDVAPGMFTYEVSVE